MTRRPLQLEAGAIDLGTAPMTTGDRAAVGPALAAVYRTAGHAPPPPARQVFVGSPLTGALAAGLASGAWHLRAHPELHHARFARTVGEVELAIALHHACEAAVARAAAAILRDRDEAPLAALRAAVRDAVTRATALVPAHPTPDPDPLAIERSTRVTLALARVELTREGAMLPPRVALPLLHEVDAAIDRIILGLGPRPEAGDVTAFLLESLASWWQTRGPTRRDVADLVQIGPTVASNGRLDLDRRPLERLATVAAHAGTRFLHPAFWIVADRPVELHRDARGRAHRDDGPAMAWADGWALHYLHGVPVAPRHTSAELSLDDIRTETNAEVRRLLIDRYERGDRGRYLRDAGATVLDADTDRLGHPRRLLRIDYGGEHEPFVAVEVTNSTPEPDGSHKRYVLRVPPTTQTCRDAVAWTFGLAPDEYEPEFET